MNADRAHDDRREHETGDGQANARSHSGKPPSHIYRRQSDIEVTEILRMAASGRPGLPPLKAFFKTKLSPFDQQCALGIVGSTPRACPRLRPPPPRKAVERI